MASSASTEGRTHWGYMMAASGDEKKKIEEFLKKNKK
jgi:hypothetical protein